MTHRDRARKGAVELIQHRDDLPYQEVEALEQQAAKLVPGGKLMFVGDLPDTPENRAMINTVETELKAWEKADRSPFWLAIGFAEDNPKWTLFGYIQRPEKPTPEEVRENLLNAVEQANYSYVGVVNMAQSTRGVAVELASWLDRCAITEELKTELFAAFPDIANTFFAAFNRGE